MFNVLRIVFLSLAFFTITNFSLAQTEADSLLKDAPRVFLDCSSCDQTFLRQNVTFVNYVRDRKLADVHVLVTAQRTGSGGRQFDFQFIGQERFENMNDTLTTTTNSNNTRDEVRNQQALILKLGLVRYLAQTDLASQLLVDFNQEIETAEIEDPWNYWIYNIDATAWFSGQESNSSVNTWSNIGGRKITPEWKVELNASLNYRESKFDVGNEVITNIQRSTNLNSRAVKSINDHWSTGAFVRGRSSIFENIDFTYRAYPGIEYNLFSYEESTRHQLRMAYHVGYEYRWYRAQTIFDKLEEGLFGNELQFAYEVREKWGSISSSLVGNAFLNDLSKNSVRFFTALNLRVLKGLSLRFRVNLDLIRNQINLPAGTASSEDILLSQREIASNYRYNGNLGFTYTFGSIYNSVVNPRMGG